jgi:hypothetical protein
MKAETGNGQAAVGALLGRLAGAARRQSREYAPERSLRGYSGAMAVFAAYCAALIATAQAKDRPLPQRIEPLDLVVGAAATYRFSKLVSKNVVTSPIRAPFTEYVGSGGPAESLEDARGTGVRRAIGELISCPFCVSVWAAATYTAGLVLCPRATRLGAAGLTVLTGADLLQLSSAALTRHATKKTDGGAP